MSLFYIDAPGAAAEEFKGGGALLNGHIKDVDGNLHLFYHN